MTWLYKQSNGELTHDGVYIGTGYSGTSIGRNNPVAQAIANVGPIPQGSYTIGNAYDDHVLGPCVMHLDPFSSTNTFGRSLFRIHGNNAKNDASHGCVIQNHAVRLQVDANEDRDLTVVA